mmetsp:Transcript_73888/g.238815  ORF Transcript_73888/g.238815 Transcript_73888/m.238815 type:complete len:368 (+) Transcript_73888:78-1181(+)
MPAVQLETHGKAVIVKGDTRAVKDFLKEKGGRWNKGLTGWIFPGSRKTQLLEDLRAKGTAVEDRTQGGSGGADAVAGSSPASKGAKRAGLEGPGGGGAGGAEGAPAKKAKSKAADGPAGQAKAGQGDEEAFVEVTDKIRATVNVFGGGVGVDLRKFYLDRDSGEMRPTPKGVRLKQNEWDALIGAVEEIDTACGASSSNGTTVQLADDLRVTVKPPDSGGPNCVDVRRFYVDRNDGELKPTKKGIYLSQAEWAAVKAAAPEIGKSFAAGGAPASSSRKAAPRPAPAVATPVAASPQPAVTAASAAISSGGLREKLVDIIKGRDLATFSLKAARGELEASLSLPKGALDGRREEIKGIVTDLLQRGGA